MNRQSLLILTFSGSACLLGGFLLGVSQKNPGQGSQRPETEETAVNAATLPGPASGKAPHALVQRDESLTLDWEKAAGEEAFQILIPELERWMALDPIRTIDWILTSRNLKSSQRLPLLLASLEGIDPEQAEQVTSHLRNALEDDDDFFSALGVIVESTGRTRRRQAIQLAKDWTSEAPDYGVLGPAINSWVWQDGVAAVNDIMVDLEGSPHHAVLLSGASASLAAAAPEAALQWLEGLKPARRSASMKEAFLGAAPVLTEIGHGERFDQIAARVSGEIFDEDSAAELARILAIALPDAANEWMNSIDDRTLRAEVSADLENLRELAADPAGPEFESELH